MTWSGDPGNGAVAVQRGNVEREEDLRLAIFAIRIGGNLMGGLASGERRGQKVQHQCQAGTLPEADRQRAIGGLDLSRNSSKPAFPIKSAVHRQQFAARAR